MKAMVMLPTYNEKENIESIVSDILKLDNVSIVVVDDDSPDGTGEIIEELAQQGSNRIHVIHRKERGRATAGFTGFQYALSQDVDCIIEMDADFSHNPAYITQFLEKATDFDVVVGSRYAHGGKDSDRSPLRTLISKIASTYTRLFLGWSIKDWSGGYKCYRKEALGSLDFGSFYSKGYAVGMETLYRLKRNGYSMIEIPIVFEDRKLGNSKFSWHHIAEYFLTSAKLRLRQDL